MQSESINEPLVHKQDNLKNDNKPHVILRILYILFYLVCVGINYIIAAQDRETFDKFHVYTSPDALFSVIWGVIFAWVFLVSLYNIILNIWATEIYVLISICGSLQVLCNAIFYQSTITAICFCCGILLFIVLFCVQTWNETGNIPNTQFKVMTYISRNSLAFWLGWDIVIFTTNIGQVLVYQFEMSKEIQPYIFIATTLVIAIGITALNCIRQGFRGALSCFCLWISLAWGIAAAAFTTQQCIRGVRDLC